MSKILNAAGVIKYTKELNHTVSGQLMVRRETETI